MGMEKRLLARESISWMIMSTDIENNVKYCSTCTGFQKMQPKENIMAHEIPGTPWKVMGADIFTINNSNFLCAVEYHSKFPIVKEKINHEQTA